MRYVVAILWTGLAILEGLASADLVQIDEQPRWWLAGCFVLLAYKALRYREDGR